ncbi:MAG: hypothetical protein ABI746_06940 [Dermatophilaceae bacterium]
MTTMHPATAGALDEVTIGGTAVRGTAGTTTGRVAAEAPEVAVSSVPTVLSDRAVLSGRAAPSAQAGRSARKARSGPAPLDLGDADLAPRAAAASRVLTATGAPKAVDRAEATGTTRGEAAKGTAADRGTAQRPAPRATAAAVAVPVGAARAAATYAPPLCFSSPRSP